MARDLNFDPEKLVRKRIITNRIVTTMCYIVLAFVLFFLFLPLFLTIISMFKTKKEVFPAEFQLFPNEWTFENFSRLLYFLVCSSYWMNCSCPSREPALRPSPAQ